MINRISIAVFTVLFVAVAAQAEEWGTLTGRFVYDGKAPAQQPLSITKDQEVCSKPPTLVDESLEVEKDGGLANVVVWLRTKDVAVNPEYAKTATEKAVLDNHHCQFVPHVLAMRNTQQLEVKNSDTMGHNTNLALISNAPFNVVIPSNTTSDKKLDSPENTPATVTCNIHPWMKAYVLVRPDPYYAVSLKDGKFEIKNLPAGKELEFQVWQEKAGNVEKASINGKDAAWKRGRFKMMIKPGTIDLGEIKLDPAQFNK